MKCNYTTILVALLLVFESYGQIQPTYNFENWVSSGTYNDPSGWVSFNILSIVGNPITVFRDTVNPHGGQYCMRITSAGLISNPSPADIPDTVGFAITGSISISPSVSVRSGSPYSARPSQITSYMRYTPAVGGDSSFFFAALTKWNGTTRDTIAVAGTVITGTVANWQAYNMPFIYNPLFSNTFPDSMTIACSATDDDFPHVGSSLYVDDVTFSGWVGIEENASVATIQIFPNPASDRITAQLSNAANKAIVYDLEGRELNQYTIIDGILRADVSTLPSGIYYCSILDERQQIIGRAKFTVNR